MPTAAVLPIKRFEEAKRRLAPALSIERRRLLAEAMVSDVLEALIRCAGVEHVLVVTVDPRARELALAAGAEAVSDPRAPGHNPAAAQGVRRALEAGARRVLLVPGDCPALRPADIDELLAAAPADAPSVVCVPDRHGTGTNALLLAPPAVIESSFGPGSFDRHRDAARAVGAAWVVRRPWPLLHDVDTAADLEALGAALAEDPAVAPRTRGLLAGHAPSPSRVGS
ncbi:MAG: 2-phospho-L-lactate guanylyltransferase [Actinobacteria bacterium]|nr:MAG: 2-phospho-L-lactate guanylyltransferase [Actinomycetota bacterium]